MNRTPRPSTLHPRHVFVSGGSNGIGRALVLELVARGCDVTTCGRDVAALDELASLGVTSVVADLATAAGRQQVAEVLADNDRLDMLVNNAAVRCAGLGTDDPDAIEREVAVNLLAPLQLVAAALPLLRRSQQGVVVNVTSVLGVAPRTRSGVYAACKSALITHTEALREELSADGIRVVELMPPPVDTELASDLTLKKMPAPEFARRALDRIDAGDNHIANGRNRLAQLTHRASRRISGLLVH